MFLVDEVKTESGGGGGGLNFYFDEKVCAWQTIHKGYPLWMDVVNSRDWKKKWADRVFYLCLEM